MTVVEMRDARRIDREGVMCDGPNRRQRLAADCLQPTLLGRFGFRQQLKAGVSQ